jgi:hypothetical protein
MVGFLQQLLTPPFPSLCPPASDVGLKFEVLTLPVPFFVCSHEVHVRYLFDPLFPQGMEVETWCPRKAVGV